MAGKIKKRKKRRRKKKLLKPRTLFSLNTECDFYGELKELLLKITSKEFEKITVRIAALGNIKLAVASGVFIDRLDSPADLLIVVNKINQNRITAFARNLGVEIGKEIVYSVMTEGEFKYRRNMYDKFLRLILESPHKKLINKIGYIGKN